MSPEEQLQAQREREEQLDALRFAASLAASMKQTVDSQVIRGSPVSKTPTIDPRSVLKQGHPAREVVARPPANNQPSNDPLAPRLNMIPLPKGVNVESVLPPELIKPSTPAPSAAPIPSGIGEISTTVKPSADTDQLELNFNRQATLNQIFDQLDTLNSKLDTLLFSFKKLETHVTDAIKPTGKKKSTI